MIIQKISLNSLAHKNKQCFYYSFSRNFGKEAAMYAGLENATGDYVVIMDADLQHPPYLLKEMYRSLKEENYDCSAGKRIDRTGEGKLRNFLSHSFYKVIQTLTKMDMDDGAGDFRMMTRQMVDAILELKEYNRYMKGLFSFVGFNTKWLEFHNVERPGGNTVNGVLLVYFPMHLKVSFPFHQPLLLLPELLVGF